MDLCSVFSENYILSALNLVKSYNHFSYKNKIYLYYFNCDKNKLFIFDEYKNQIELIEVEKLVDYAHNPKAFFYKLYALNDCRKKTNSFIYSDITNCFVSEAKKIHNDLIDNCLFIAYPYEKLINKYWTTKKCFDIMKSPLAEIMPQYWAAFQAYNVDKVNANFIEEMYEYACLKECLLPEVGMKFPDGNENVCIEHRQDQSILSLMINKYNKHQFYDVEKYSKYGDWQTLQDFDKNYKHNFDNTILSSRESKFGFYRFLK